MRKSIVCSTVVFVLILFASVVYAANVNVLAATSDFYVNDFAGVFSPAEKARLMERAVALANEHDGIQVVVTTVKSLDGNSIEEYAHEMYNQYRIGKADMGILLVLATEDRKIRVEVGKAMEAYINDSKAGRFIDKYAIPSLKDNKFSEGLMSLQGALIDEVISSIKNTNVKPDADETDEEKVVDVVVCSLVTLLLLDIVINSARKDMKDRRTRKSCSDSFLMFGPSSSSRSDSGFDSFGGFGGFGGSSYGGGASRDF